MPESPIDTYLAKLAEPARSTLEKIRAIVRRAVPDAEEGMSYGLAAFIYRGKPLFAFNAAAEHCAVYPMSGQVLDKLGGAVAGYDRSKGTLRFPVDSPPPAALIQAILNARLQEIGGPAKAPASGPSARKTVPRRAAAKKGTGRGGVKKPAKRAGVATKKPARRTSGRKAR